MLKLRISEEGPQFAETPNGFDRPIVSGPRIVGWQLWCFSWMEMAADEDAIPIPISYPRMPDDTGNRKEVLIRPPTGRNMLVCHVSNYVRLIIPSAAVSEVFEPTKPAPVMCNADMLVQGVHCNRLEDLHPLRCQCPG